MSQVIQNIIINAKQAMPEGGKVLISTENVTGENGMKHLRISIKDTGIGIPENHLVKIFDPYFTTKQTGSGLGLSVCYSVVQKHGGRIFVESKIGIGTIFHIMLPAKAKVVVSSGYSDDPIMSDPLKYGFIAAISKPYQIKDLTKIVSSVLEN